MKENDNQYINTKTDFIDEQILMHNDCMISYWCIVFLQSTKKIFTPFRIKNKRNKNNKSIHLSFLLKMSFIILVNIISEP